MGEHETPLDGIRVLVVEDEYYLADDLSRSLSSAGAEVVAQIGTLEGAKSRLEAGDFDVAVVDMNLRGDFAYGLAERLNDLGVPFIVTTGYNRDSLPDALKDVERIEKPFTPTEVVNRIAAMCPKVHLNG